MSRDKEVDEVVSAIISKITISIVFLVELKGVLTVMFARERSVKKRLLLLISSDSKTQNGKKESRRSPPRFWVRPHP